MKEVRMTLTDYNAMRDELTALKATFNKLVKLSDRYDTRLEAGLDQETLRELIAEKFAAGGYAETHVLKDLNGISFRGRTVGEPLPTEPT